MKRNMRLAMCSTLLLLPVAAIQSRAQNEAPFTIRRPLDGATVREKVKVQIPLASIPEGGYVAIVIDGELRGAMAVTEEDRNKIREASLKSNEPPYFTYVWDTKALAKGKLGQKDTLPVDGQHSIAAKLYGPKPSKNGVDLGGSDLKETSSVNVVLANKYDPGTISPLKLLYKFTEGENRDYKRTGSSVVVAGLTQGMTGSGDLELVSYTSDMLVAVEDRYPTGNAMVRNKVRSLDVKQGGQSTHYPTDQLPRSLYQEVDPWGGVSYQNSTASFDQFASLGVPVSATLEMPALPRQSISVNDTWRATKVKLEIPGTAPDKQPEVDMESKFVGFEWEGGYPTAHILQTYDSAKSGGLKQKDILFGTVEVSNPQIKFSQDIYVAYRSGKLIKVVKELEVVGKTTQQVGGGAAPGMGAAGGGPGAMMGSGGGSGAMMGAGGGSSQSMMMNAMARGGAGAYGGGRGSGGPSSAGGMMGGAGRGAKRGDDSGMMGGRGSGGMMAGRGSSGMMAGRGSAGMMAGRGSAGMMGPGAPGGMGMPSGGTGTAGSASTQITLKSRVVTEAVVAPARTASK